MTDNRPIMRALSVLIAAILFGGLTAKAEKKPWVRIENNVMTFLYGEKEALLENEYELNEGNAEPAWHGMAQEIKKVAFDASFKDARPTSCYEWFKYFRSLTDIEGMENLNTSEVTTMKEMFDECYNLVNLDLSHFDTREVTDMSFMLTMSMNLGYLDLSSFDTQNVTDMTMMFFGSNVQYIFVSDKFTTSKVTKGRDMFFECELLSGAIRYDFDHRDYTYANTTNGYFTDVKLKDDVKYYWEKCEGKTVTFYYGKKNHIGENESYLKIMDGGRVPHQDEVETAVIDESLRDVSEPFCNRWFERFENLTEIKGLENLNTAKMTDMGGMFYNCEKLRSLDLSSFDTSNVTNMGGMFWNCVSLQTLDLSSFDTRNVTDMHFMFCTCLSLPYVDISKFNTSKVEDTNGMFYQCFSLRKIFTGDGVNMDKVTDSKNMFASSFALEGAIEYDESKTGAEYANTASGYFTDAKEKANTKFGWTRHDGNTLTYYYDKKPKLEANERYVTQGHLTQEPWMKGITRAVFDKSFEEARTVSSGQWFMGFSSLTDIEGWENVNTDKLIDIDDMFNGCEKLENLDLSNINTTKVQLMNQTFSGCTSLKRIYVGRKFSTASVLEGESEGTFNGCPAAIYCPANSYAAISTSKILEGRDFMAYADINPAMEYGTLCVPQGCDLAADTYEGFDKLYTVNQIDAANGQAILKEEKLLEPGKAYIYHRNLPTDYFKAVVAYKPNAATVAEPLTNGLLRGTFTETTAPTNSYVLNEDALLHLAAADATTVVDANQAYLLPSTEAGATLPNTLTLKIDSALGVKEILNSDETTVRRTVFDLMGRRVNTLVRGRVYIENGKKILKH